MTDNINEGIPENQQPTIWTDPEVAELKFEIKNLEEQLTAFENEKIELEKLLSEFHHRNSIELGDIILKILELRKLKFKSDREKYEEAENDEREYREQVNTEKEKEVYELNDEQKVEIKKKFRKATFLCHPDKFVNEPIEIQKQAEEIFKELNNANEKNDLNRVAELLANLEKGILTTLVSDKEADKEKLIATINRLKEKVKKLEEEIIVIQQSNTYKEIIGIENWDEYFSISKERLQKELEELELETEE